MARCELDAFEPGMRVTGGAAVERAIRRLKARACAPGARLQRTKPVRDFWLACRISLAEPGGGFGRVTRLTGPPELSGSPIIRSSRFSEESSWLVGCLDTYVDRGRGLSKGAAFLCQLKQAVSGGDFL